VQLALVAVEPEEGQSDSNVEEDSPLDGKRQTAGWEEEGVVAVKDQLAHIRNVAPSRLEPQKGQPDDNDSEDPTVEGMQVVEVVGWKERREEERKEEERKEVQKFWPWCQ
jgi:hypothetical protein